MDSNTKTNGQVKRLVLDIDGVKIALDTSVTKEEALSLIDILAKGAKRLEPHYATVGGSYTEFAYAEKSVDVSLRVTGSEIHESRADAQAAADAAAAKEVAK